MNSLLGVYAVSVFLVLIQVLAALPWLAVLTWDQLRSRRRTLSTGTLLTWLGSVLLGIGILGAGLAALIRVVQLNETLARYGGIYGAVLHVQWNIDLFVLVFAVLFLLWPKGAAVALSAFREGWRQPMFWLLLALALVLLFISPFIPYFTLGEDFKMVKEQGYDVIMLAALIFGVIAASMSISEEIEGRTAVTLMSKPVSRRQFLLGKFAGIFLAAVMMISILTLVFDGVFLFKLTWEIGENQSIPSFTTVNDWSKYWTGQFGEMSAAFLRGVYYWLVYAGSLLPGVVLGLCQVMVLLAVSVALATRLTMIVNLVLCLVVFFLGHLASVLEEVSRGKYRLVHFVAQLFSNLFPGLELFSMGPAIARDTPLDPGPFSAYIGTVVLYALLYTTIALLFGLLLFEDRDLA